MKKVLSLMLCVMMLASVFAFNASAALPLEQDKTINPSVTEAALIEAQTYEDSENTIFTRKDYDTAGIETVKENPDDAESNTVIELKYSALLTFEEDGTTVKTSPRYNNAQLLDGTQKTNQWSDGTTIPKTYMVEFDVCAKDNSIGLAFTRRGIENGVQAGVAIDPDSMTEGTWYTYRLYVDESGYRAETDGTAARTAFKNGVTAFRKERGSAADFEDVTSNLINIAAGNGAMGFVLFASDKYVVADDVDQTNTYYMTSSTRDVFVDAFAACYQLDNIGVSAYTIPEDFEISTGIMNTYDMESVSTSTRENGAKFEQGYEENGNGYMKISCDLTHAKLTAANAARVGYSAIQKITEGSEISDYFAMTFDVNNLVPGLALTLEVYSDDDGYVSGGTDCYGRNKIIIKSDSALANTWYTYKIIFDDSDNDGNLNPVIYRRLRGSNDPWVELVTHRGKADEVDSTVHEAFLQGTNSSGTDKTRAWRIGYFSEYLSAYANDAVDENNVLKNFAAEWAIDNVQFVDGVGVTGTASASGETVAADINVAGATLDCAPIVAVYDAQGRMVDLGSATVSGEGKVSVTADGYQEGYKAKLFIWESISAGLPLLKDGIDITSFL